MTQSPARTDLRVLHGAIFVLLLACGAMVPMLRAWPWIWLAPFIVYFAIVASVPQLRCSTDWLQWGSCTPHSLAATFGLMLATVLTLSLFQSAAQPDVFQLRAALPIEALGGTIMAGVIFTIVNATLEEFVFRGGLFDSLMAR